MDELHAQVLMAMNMFTATHTCVMVYINDHRLYCILASLYLSIGWNMCVTFLSSFCLGNWKQWKLKLEIEN